MNECNILRKPVRSLFFPIIFFFFLIPFFIPVARITGQGSLTLDEIWIRDPNIIHYNGTYYMTGTTTGDGFLGYSSTDLVHWEAQGYIYQRNSSSIWALQYFWAPEMVYKNGSFFLFFTANSSTYKRATGVAIADNPMGPYTDLCTNPLTPPEWECLDGHLFTDNDGKEYLIFVHEWTDAEFGEMWMQEISSDYTSLVGEKTYLFKGTDASWSNIVVDGPSMLYKDGIYYLFWSSFGKRGYNVGYAYADELNGPYFQSKHVVIQDDGGA